MRRDDELQVAAPSKLEAAGNLRVLAARYAATCLLAEKTVRDERNVLAEMYSAAVDYGRAVDCREKPASLVVISSLRIDETMVALRTAAIRYAGAFLLAQDDGRATRNEMVALNELYRAAIDHGRAFDGISRRRRK